MNTLDKILYLLKKNGIAEIEFAKKINANQSIVSEWKKGKTKSYNKRLPKIAEVLGVSIDYLISEDDYKSCNENVECVEQLMSIKTNINDIEYLSEDEKILIDNYRKLDHRSKTRVNNFIYEEIDYLNNIGDTKKISDYRKKY